jgi:signal recognition particle receptor subunit beta
MVFFNYSTMQMAAKVVYYGPGLCGKTTNLQWIFEHTSTDSRGEMVSLATETDRTLFFDLLPIDVGSIAGFNTRIQLYTVPGQVFYNTTRKLVLKGVDGVVFVADSQPNLKQANLDSFKNLEENLAEMGLSLDTIPVVLQYNKRDLPNVLSVEELNGYMNPHGWPALEASALNGDGVFETLKTISKATLLALKKRLTKSKDTGPSVSSAPRRPMAPKPAPPKKPPTSPGLAAIAAPATAATPGPAPQTGLSPNTSSSPARTIPAPPPKASTTPLNPRAGSGTGPVKTEEEIRETREAKPTGLLEERAKAKTEASTGPFPEVASPIESDRNDVGPLDEADPLAALSPLSGGRSRAPVIGPPSLVTEAPTQAATDRPAAHREPEARAPTPEPFPIPGTTTESPLSAATATPTPRTPSIPAPEATKTNRPVPERRKKRARAAGFDALAELEKLRLDSIGSTPTAINGARQVNKDFRLILKRSDLVRARRFSLKIQLEDEKQQALDEVQHLHIDIENAESLKRLLLRLEIALDSKT